MHEEFLVAIENEDVNQRFWGWSGIDELLDKNEFLPTPQQFQRIAELHAKEDSERIRRIGSGVLFRVLAQLNSTRHSLQECQRTSSIAQWFWSPFQEPSIVMRVTDSLRIRDEEGVIELARHLSNERFPKTIFMRIPPANPEFEKMMNTIPAQACALAGRVGIFGHRAAKVFESKKTAFYFPVGTRPAGLMPNELDSKFHCIKKRASDSGEEESFHSKDVDGDRTDYALVQRYPAKFNGKPIIAVICAGCSTLGTLAACRWAANLHKMNIAPNDKLEVDTCFEALLKVKAEVSSFPMNWNPYSTELIHLHIGSDNWQEVWDVKKEVWSVPPAKKVEVKYDKAGKPAKLLINGEAYRGQKDSLMISLIVSLLELAKGKADQTVSLQDLYKHPRIVPEVDQHKKNLGQNLGRFRTRMGPAYAEFDEKIRINAKIILTRPQS